jgi:hypothetical protein
MFEISGMKRMLEDCGVPGKKSEKLVNVLEQAMLHGLKGTEVPPYTGWTPDDLRLATKVASTISVWIARRGKLKRDHELRVGDIVVPAGETGGWKQRLVLKHDVQNRTIRYSRPYGSMSGAGTTCPSMYVGIEDWESPYNADPKWQTQYIVVGRDDCSLMEISFSTIRCISRERLNAYINVLRTAMGLENWEADRIAKMEWVNLQEEAMRLACELIKKELDVPYPE